MAVSLIALYWATRQRAESRLLFQAFQAHLYCISTVGDNMQSIILDRCWCCGSKIGLNNHHCVPQAYGGVNGPQVTLCATHHTLIHQLALTSPDRWEAELTDPLTRGKLIQLVQIIYRARMAMRSVERPLQLQFKLNLERSRKLRELKALTGASSLQSAIERCIDTVYDQLTPLKKN